jgi:hypothetical protein
VFTRIVVYGLRSPAGLNIRRGVALEIEWDRREHGVLDGPAVRLPACRAAELGFVARHASEGLDIDNVTRRHFHLGPRAINDDVEFHATHRETVEFSRNTRSHDYFVAASTRLKISMHLLHRSKGASSALIVQGYLEYRIRNTPCTTVCGIFGVLRQNCCNICRSRGSSLPPFAEVDVAMLRMFDDWMPLA